MACANGRRTTLGKEQGTDNTDAVCRLADGYLDRTSFVSFVP
jgi:hypothetical protein